MKPVLGKITYLRKILKWVLTGVSGENSKRRVKEGNVRVNNVHLNPFLFQTLGEIMSNRREKNVKKKKTERL